MTREEAKSKKRELEMQREELVKLLTAPDVSSATLSSTGGSKSYTNRSVAEIKAKITFLDKEIGKINAALGIAPSPTDIRSICPRYVR